jgi:hypothetical protein
MLEKLTYPYPIQYNVERYIRSTGEWKLIAEIPVNFKIDKREYGTFFARIFFVLSSSQWVQDRLETLRQARTAAYDIATKSPYRRITEIIQYPGTTREFTAWQNDQWLRELV